MNSIGLSLLFKMGCICSKETIDVNGHRYILRSRIGEGGFSLIDLVEDPNTHELFALKRMVCHSKEDERQAMREVEYHNAFNHPNILPCIDSCLHQSSQGYPNQKTEVLVVLPFLKGGTLHDELQRRSAQKNNFSEDFILRTFHKICLAVKEMHHAKPEPLAHRDLKPANVLLNEDGSPVLMDLGSMAKARVEIHSSAEARKLQDVAAERCSMAYRAPELFNVDPHCVIDERTDIWSLGCLLYALCFYKSPFDSAYERGDSVALAVMSGNIQIPENSQYSDKVHNLITSMLKVQVMDRPFVEVVISNVEKATYALENRV